MFTNTKCLSAGVICVSLALGAAALAEPTTSTPAGAAPTTWAPPAEIAPKTAAPAAAPAPSAESPAGAGQPANAAPAAKTHAERERDCRAQADAKGLHGKERKRFKAGCLKG